jgi:hypothetical protein
MGLPATTPRFSGRFGGGWGVGKRSVGTVKRHAAKPPYIGTKAREKRVFLPGPGPAVEDADDGASLSDCRTL